jgi:hypothetical protein
MRLTVPETDSTRPPGLPAVERRVTVKARASAPNLQATTADITGAVTPKGPGLFPAGSLANLNSQNGAPLPAWSPRSLAPRLRRAAEPGVVPLPKTFNGTRVVIGGFEAPLYFLSDGQLNVQIPTELAPIRSTRSTSKPTAATLCPTASCSR